MLKTLFPPDHSQMVNDLSNPNAQSQWAPVEPQRYVYVCEYNCGCGQLSTGTVIYIEGSAPTEKLIHTYKKTHVLN